MAAPRHKQAKKPANKAGNKKSAMPCEDVEAVNSDSQQERLDRELLWCIEQLRLGITGRSSTDDKQEMVKVLRMLEKSSTPAAKKRLLMKSTFGDYRKKMADELREIDCASRSNLAKICMKPAPHSDQRKSLFYRRSNSASSSSSAAAESFHCDVSAMSDTAGDKHFMFNFITDDAVDDKTDRQETDQVSSNSTDSDTMRVRNTLTSSMTGSDTSTSTLDRPDCDKNVTTACDNLMTLNSALCFNTSAQGTPFLFNFDSC